MNRRIVVCVAVVVGALAFACTTENATTTTGPTSLVTRVVDGDTLEVRFEGRLLTVRLIGIDSGVRRTRRAG